MAVANNILVWSFSIAFEGDEVSHHLVMALQVHHTCLRLASCFYVRYCCRGFCKQSASWTLSGAVDLGHNQSSGQALFLCCHDQCLTAVLETSQIKSNFIFTSSAFRPLNQVRKSSKNPRGGIHRTIEEGSFSLGWIEGQ